ncbi:MAG: PqqD family protein [Acidobacteriota bacterium]|nr:PqqD family protein [Acidobacteriota bacterium]
MKVPQARVDLRLMDLGAELMLCDDERKLVHILNSTARRIWDLCDGTHGVDEIAAEISAMFPGIPRERVLDDVQTALADLEAKGVIAWVAQEASQPGE